jgi:ribosome-binding protein aMBF1 (putative translation factor)
MNRRMVDCQIASSECRYLSPGTSVSEPRALYVEDSQEYQRLREVFAEVLQEFRIAKDISQEELALRCVLDRAFISLLEHGKRAPSLFTVYKLSKALEVSMADFIKAIESRL